MARGGKSRGGGAGRGGRGGGRGGKGGGGRGGKGGGDAASSGGLDDYATSGADVDFAESSTRKRSSASQDGHASARRGMGRDDMFDDVDEFIEGRHRVALDKRAAAEEEDEEDDYAPGKQNRGQSFELEGLEDDEDEEEEDEEDEGQQHAGYDEVEAAEAKAARARELESEANISKGWGKNKSLYYSADTQDFEVESDEDIALEEEKEGKRLQAEAVDAVKDQVDDLDDMMAMVAAAAEEGAAAKDAKDGKGKRKKAGERSDAELLQALDEDLEGIDMALDLDLDIPALTNAGLPAASSAAAGAKKGKKAAGSAEAIAVERITKDMSRLDESQKLELLLTSSPELLSLLDDFKQHMADLGEMLPVWEEIKDQQESTDKAWYCYVSLKVSSLLLYCCHVSFYLSMKADGKANITQHPIMKTLLGLRKTLQQLEPMEAHFAAMQHDDAEDDEDAEEEQLDGEEEEEEEGLEAGEDDEEEQDEDGEDDEGMEGLEGEEDGFSGEEEAPLDPENLAAADLMSRQSAQLERLIASGLGPARGDKKAAKKAKALAAASGKTRALSDFGEVDHKAEMARNVTVGKASGKLAALQAKLNQAASAEDKKKGTKRKIAEDDDGDAADDDETGGWSAKKAKGAAPKADAGADLYAKLAADKAAAKAARKAQYEPLALPATWKTMSEEERRAASKQIKANRGLVRSRRKDKKTPKTANRLRYEKKLVARSGAVQEFKGSQAANYGGQATGIKTTVTKSISLRQ